MAIQQHYFTSWVNPEAAAGFQTRAVSNGLTAEIVKDLESYLDYHIGAEMMVQPHSEHPTALKYVPSHNHSYLIHVVSSGKEEKGRDGNVFAHSLVGPIDHFIDMFAPVLAWGSDTWVKTDPAPGQVIRLPALPDVPTNPAFNFDDLYAFVNQRRPLYAKLLTAVINYPKLQRRIVIIDSDENVMRWVAAVSIALPSRIACMLSFTTYSYNFKSVPYLLTGVPQNTSVSTGDRHSYVVLDGAEGTISEIQPSAYASFVAEGLSSKFQDEILTEFLPALETYLHGAGQDVLAQQIDGFLTMWGQQAHVHHKPAYNAEVLTQQAHVILTHINTLTQQRSAYGLQFLPSLIDALAEQTRVNPTSQFVNTLVTAVKTLRPHDQDSHRTATTMLNLGFSLLAAGRTDEAGRVFDAATRYDERVVSAALNQDSNLAQMAHAMNNKPAATIAEIWRDFGPLLRFNPTHEMHYKRLIYTSLDAINVPTLQARNIAVPNQNASVLILYMLNSKLDVELVLKMAFKHAHDRSSLSFGWVYYMVLQNKTEGRRGNLLQSWWNQQMPPNFDIRVYELYCDLREAEQPIQVMKHWQQIMSEQEFAPTYVNAIYSLWEQQSPLQPDIAAGILTDDKLANLGERVDKNWAQRLFNHINEVAPEHPALNKIYEHIETGQLPIQLTPQQRQAYFIKKTLNKSSLTERDFSNLHGYFRSIESESEYRQQVEPFVEKFFLPKENEISSHNYMVYMTYNDRHAPIFFDMYWSQFHRLLLDLKFPDKAVLILAYWFDHPHEGLSKSAKLNFWMRAAGEFTSLEKKQRKFQKIRDSFVKAAQRHEWWPVVEQYLPKDTSNGLLGMFKR
jgi:hypothetical protein